MKGERTIVISFPAAFLNDLVHRTFLGFRFILREGEEKRRGGEGQHWGVRDRNRGVLRETCLSRIMQSMMGEYRVLWEMGEVGEEGKSRNPFPPPLSSHPRLSLPILPSCSTSTQVVSEPLLQRGSFAERLASLATVCRARPS